MKITQRVTRAVRYALTLGHLRHYRGHGVHSPFVYRVVREAAMRKREIISEEQSLYTKLREMGFGHRRSVQIQNFYTICGCDSFVVDQERERIDSGTMWIVTTATSPDRIASLTSQVGIVEAVVCIIFPRNSAARYRATKKAIKQHNGLSIDSISFISLHCNDKRIKQHIII